VFDHVVVGASDPDAMAGFFGNFGFAVTDRSLLSAGAADAYGLSEGAAVLDLSVPGAESGRVRLIGTDLAADDYSQYAPRVEALDLYTRDMAASLELIERLGLSTVGPAADFPFGPLRLQQVAVYGPDSVMLVLVDINHRLPSVLDDDSDQRLHSELHSVVCVVDDLDSATSYFTDAGLELRATFPLAEPAVPAFMGLPRPSTMRMSVLGNAESAPPRFELLQFDDESAPPRPSLPLRPGALLPVFVADVDAAATSLREPVWFDGAVAGVTAQGVPVQVQSEPLR
jgi:catechol 2,3-dioxygenase-like lactoylglutathione lyase family enzyme